jgi:hypothetical protein
MNDSSADKTSDLKRGQPGEHAMSDARRKSGFAHLLLDDACPLCHILKEFQSAQLRSLNADMAKHLCSYHLWSVAAVTEVTGAAEVFLRLLEDSSPGESHACDLCKRVADEERKRVEEFSGFLGRPDFQEWLEAHGALCLPHSKQLSAFVSRDLQKDLRRAVQRHSEDLKHKLTKLLRDAKEGKSVRAGVLGRVAEFLMAQRGLGRYG